MVPVLKVLEFLRILGIARDCIKRLPGRGASLLAFLGRRLNTWYRFWLGNFGDFGRYKLPERRIPGTEASSYSVSGGSAVVREYVVAASSVPAWASLPSLHEQERTESQLAQTVDVHPPVPTSIIVDYPHTPNPLYAIGGTSLGDRSSGNLSAFSIQSRASDRFSFITNSLESIRTTHGQPSRYPRATHRQFGRGPGPARSKERLSRPSSPTTRPHTLTHPTHPLRLGINTTLPSTHGTSSSHDGPPLGSPTPSNHRYHSALDFILPEGRFVQLINSDQISRYAKVATMQVGYTTLSLHLTSVLQTPRGDSL
jgi:hypothetical protein